MSTKNGTIHVETENIFPIIKKFLYSDHEIFLRELVSNAVDASQKLMALSSLGEFNGDAGDLKVEVITDKEAGTITIRDYGIGMTEEEIDRYINQIAFSGAQEFVEKYKDKATGIIGHFGLGFYSAFMVAKHVDIITLSYKEGSAAVKWSCDGSPNYTLDPAEKTVRGTDIVLHIAEDSVEFLEDSRIKDILNKYCKFLPVPVFFGTKTEWIDSPTGEKDEDGEVKQETIQVPNQINNTRPLWTKAPAGLSQEDYTAFYRELYPYAEEPLFHIHLNVDYPFNLTGILYFPRLRNQIEVQKNKIQLYSRQVFITENVEGIVPDFLTLLHGVLDSPDIPLNVSRSYLQSDANVKKISNHIMKKVADKLEEMHKNDPEDFKTKWDDIKVFIEYGMLTEDKFYERAEKFALLKNLNNEYYTLEEYSKKIEPHQKDKNDNLVVLYTSDTLQQHAYLEAAKQRNYDVVILDSPLTPHFVGKLEQKNSKLNFKRVDADTIDKLIEKDEQIPSKLTQEQEGELLPLFKEAAGEDKFMVKLESLNESDAPVIITQTEFMRRMQEQQRVGGGGGMMGAFPEFYNIAVNGNHPIIQSILEAKTDARKKKLAKQLVDLGKLSRGLLQGEELTGFINRSVDLIK
jgi:molecular chaperone HtpG